eukprot:512788_1
MYTHIYIFIYLLLINNNNKIMSTMNNIKGHGKSSSSSSKVTSTKSNKLNKRKIKNKDNKIHPIIKETPQSKDNQMQTPITRSNITRIKGKKDNNNYNNKIDGYGAPSTPSELKIDNNNYNNKIYGY